MRNEVNFADIPMTPTLVITIVCTWIPVP